MQDDLHMSDTVWSTGISMFYVGYIITQIPSSIIMAKGKPRFLLPGCMLAWSAVTICMPAVKSGWAFCLCRFLVGFTEGPFVPAVSLMTSSWYTKRESPLRMGIWHAGNTISQAISGLLAAGILTNMDNVANLRAWQWFLLLEGERPLSRMAPPTSSHWLIHAVRLTWHSALQIRYCQHLNWAYILLVHSEFPRQHRNILPYCRGGRDGRI